MKRDLGHAGLPQPGRVGPPRNLLQRETAASANKPSHLGTFGEQVDLSADRVRGGVNVSLFQVTDGAKMKEEQSNYVRNRATRL